MIEEEPKKQRERIERRERRTTLENFEGKSAYKGGEDNTTPQHQTAAASQKDRSRNDAFEA